MKTIFEKQHMKFTISTSIITLLINFFYSYINLLKVL